MTPQTTAPGDATAWALDPDVAHLNHGSFGAVTRATQTAAAAARRHIDANPTRFFTREAPTLVDHATTATADFIGAEPGTVALVANATEATHLVLGSVDWSPGDVVVTTDHAYPAVRHQVRRLVEQRGAVERRVSLPLGAPDDDVVAAVAAAAAGARLVVVDAITSPTAWRLPVERLVPAVRATGARIMVDAAHVPGQEPARVRTLGADYWVGNLHKWACVPPSVAAVAVAPDLVATMPPPLPSSVDEERWPASARWRGTRDLVPILLVPSVLSAAGAFATEPVRSRLVGLARRSAERVADALGVAAVSLPPCAMSLVPLPTPPSVDTTVVQRAIAEQLDTEVAVTRLGEETFLRISAHVYVSDDDVDRLADGIGRVVGSVSGGAPRG